MFRFLSMKLGSAALRRFSSALCCFRESVGAGTVDDDAEEVEAAAAAAAAVAAAEDIVEAAAVAIA